MRLAEGNALAHKVIGQFGGIEEASLAGLAHAVGAEGELFKHAGHEAQRGFHRAVGIKKTFLVFLHVAVIGQGQALHDREQARKRAVNAPGLAAHKLGNVGIFLLRHDGRAGGIAV